MMQIYDTMKREKISFSPESDNTVRMYTCGPTIYNFAHIGNLRTFVFEDVLAKAITFAGHKLFHVMNITDIDDKTIKGATEKGVSLENFTTPFEIAFFEDLDKLNVQRANNYPKATEFVSEMIEMIQVLIEKGYAYTTETGDVFFRIKEFKEYGRLSHLDMSALKEGSSNRVDADEYDKESACDFVLWKSYDSDRDGNIYWDSPFGKGRPGWHLECSCMSMHYLGETFDLHTGGVDNIFPHHENEIAQSECCSGKQFSKYWMHSEHLIVNGKKMSKSLGNFYTLRDLEEKGYSSREVRALFISAHYRMQFNFTMDGLLAMRKSLARIDAFVSRLNESRGEKTLDLSSFEDSYKEAILDDLNTPKALSVLYDLIRFVNAEMDKHEVNGKAILETLKKFDHVLGIVFSKNEERIDPEIVKACEQRFNARKEKNYDLADKMREFIEKAGYIVEDKKDKCEVRRK